MNKKFRSLGVYVCGSAVLATGLSATPAFSERGGCSKKQDRPTKETKQEAKAFSQGVIAAIKVSDSCHRARNAGRIDAGIDCGNLASDQADSAGAFAKAVAKLSAGQSKLDSNPDVPPPTDPDSNFTTCPEPCRTTTGVPEPMVTWVQVGECFVCLTEEILDQRSDSMQGTPTVPLGAPEQACTAAIAKGYAKRVKTALQSRIKCQFAQDKLDQCLLQPCDTDDTKNKILTARTKAEALIDKACAGANLALLDSCADTNLTDLKACLLVADDATIGAAFSDAFVLKP